MFSLIILENRTFLTASTCMDPKLKEGKDSFSMSRMLEGTPSDIYSKLTPIRPDTLRELAKLPVLFMTETYTKDDEYDTNKYIRIRLGEIKKFT
ncbi:hypothetical protein O5171_06380 [Escherichia coli]|nr:hypothetical protein [Escherichia coli]